MRIVFAGTPAPAVPTLNALLASDHEVVGVITRPPARTGRGRILAPSPVAEVATAAGLEIIEASSLRNDEIRTRIAGLGADLGVVVAYGALIPQAVLDVPRLGWVNLHFSDLPRWRGAAPVQWAILSGDESTASCVFRLEVGLDTGPVFSRLPVEIRRETSGELLDRMALLGADQVVDVVDALAAGTALALPQDGDEGVTHARRLTHEDGFIDFAASADEVDRRVRAVTPNPGAWTTMPSGKRMKIAAVEPVDTEGLEPGRLAVSKKSVEVGCGQGAVRLLTIAPAGKGWMDGAAWARGARPTDDARLGAKDAN